MLQEAASALGIGTVVLANSRDESAAQVAAGVEIGSPDDLAALRRLAARSDVVTFDHELVEPGHLAALAGEGHVLRPGPTTLEVAVNKLEQRRRFAAAGLPLPAWARAEAPGDIEAFAREHGWPVVVKAARGGYDGRGVWVCAGRADVADVPRLGDGGVFVVEEFLALERELALLVARREDGESAVYPVVETVQRDGVCHEVIAPAPIGDDISAEARRIGEAVAEAVGSSGNLAIEMFVANGRVLINEIAARPHNAGHYSIEGCVTSQFENHLRAVLGWPLGSTALVAQAVVMVNIFGNALMADPVARIPDVLGVEGAHVHWYGKESRPGRKLGHVTALADTVEKALATARQAAAALDPREMPA
jgi:5-(carboxyamino)imidazole ribonucleotide synthase